MNKPTRRINISGKRFGKLVAIKDVGSKHGARLWECECDCGAIVVHKISKLRNLHTKSCGCYRKEAPKLSSKWKGGYRNKGTLAWANNRIATLNSQSDRLGYKRLDATADDVIRLFERCGAKCNICGIPQEELSYGMHLDHCHTTGKARGFLCQHCNRGLGLFYDDTELLTQAANYLEQFKGSDGTVRSASLTLA